MKLLLKPSQIKKLAESRIADLNTKFRKKSERIIELKKRISELKGDNADSEYKESLECDVERLEKNVRDIQSSIKTAELWLQYPPITCQETSVYDLRASGLIESYGEFK